MRLPIRRLKLRIAVWAKDRSPSSVRKIAQSGRGVTTAPSSHMGATPLFALPKQKTASGQRQCDPERPASGFKLSSIRAGQGAQDWLRTRRLVR